MKNASTHSEEPLSFLEAPPPNAELLGLVVIWSRFEPTRLGEVLLIPLEGSGRSWSVGRGDYGSGEWLDRLKLFRQRPGRLDPTGSLQCPRISRSQLRIRVLDRETLEVLNLGRCPLLLNGEELTEARVRMDDVLELKNELLLLCVRRPSFMRSLPERLAYPDFAFGKPDPFGMVGESTSIWELRRQIAVIARQSHHVLLLGVSGSGKELAARAIHGCSDRARRELIARNAATFPEGLIDAELFGNMRNYPNPGMPERPGLVGQADGSTLFLDEFAELPPGLQAHLLRVMDEGEYQRLGETRARTAKLRLIAATNRPEHHIKHDVLARLKNRLQLPDLNARREDIPLLIQHLLARHARQDPHAAERFFRDGELNAEARMTPALMTALVRHRYRTHVRELEGLLLEAMNEAQGRFIELNPVLARKLEPVRPTSGQAAPRSGGDTRAPMPASVGEEGLWDDLKPLPFHPEEALGQVGAPSPAPDTAPPSDDHTPDEPASPALPSPAAASASSLRPDGRGKASPAFSASPVLDGWRAALLESLHARLLASAEQEPSYETLHQLCEDLKTFYVARVVEANDGRLLAAARELQCNRDVVRRYLARLGEAADE